MNKEAIIQVNNLVAQYGDEVILNNINFNVYEGEILAILGGSGCGKTTLLRHLVGLNDPASGRIIIDGDDITSCDEVVFQKILRKIGISFQGSALFGSMTVAENVALPIEEYSGLSQNAINNLVKMKLLSVNMTGYEHFLPSEISGGMKKRTGFARALALNPKILFLDEPTAGLDPVSSAEIDNLILQINKDIGTTIVIVTHELESILTVSNRAIMLDKTTKGIIAEGDPRIMKEQSENELVKNFFNRRPGVNDNKPERKTI